MNDAAGDVASIWRGYTMKEFQRIQTYAKGKKAGFKNRQTRERQRISRQELTESKVITMHLSVALPGRIPASIRQ